MTLRIRRTGLSVEGDPAAVSRIQKRLATAARPVWPVVRYFAGELKKSVDFDFSVGGRSPFVWRPNRPNTIAAKGHARQLIGAHGNRMQRGIQYLPKQIGNTDYEINVRTPFPGELHQRGRAGPWIIRPRRARFLRFVVAEPRPQFLARRRAALARRRSGRKTRVPAQPAKIVVFAKVVRHPGYPARKFVVVREGLVREGWRIPVQRFLFEGWNPPGG